MAAPKAVPTTCILWAHVRRVTLKARTILFCPVAQNVLYVWRNQAIKVIPQFQKKQNQIASTHYYFRESKFTLKDSKALSFLPFFFYPSFQTSSVCALPSGKPTLPCTHPLRQNSDPSPSAVRTSLPSLGCGSMVERSSAMHELWLPPTALQKTKQNP